MKKFVILGDMIVLIYLVWLGITEDVSDDGSLSILLFLAVLVLIISNIYFLLLLNDRDSWLGMFVKRKTLEEKKKIETLEKLG